MAKTTGQGSARGKAPQEPGVSLLPVPQTVVRHHEETLNGPISEWFKQGRVPPVLLITGISGIGKRSMAYHLAQWIHCERNGFGQTSGQAEFQGSPLPEESTIDFFGGGAQAAPAQDSSPASIPTGHSGRPCGECPSCQRAVHGNWVDFTEILPEGEDGESATGALKIEQFRRLKSRQGFGAHQGRYKIILIPNADRMTAQAANSILKLLEEPPAGWVFFLTANDVTLLLPTIVSRCQTVKLKPFPPESLERLLQETVPGIAGDEVRQRVCASLAQGSWSRALRLADPETWEQRKSIFAFLKDPKSGVNGLVDWAATDPRGFDLLVDQLEESASDLIRWSVQPETGDPDRHAWINADGREALSAHARALSRGSGGLAGAREFWIARAERLARARAEVLTPLNRKLLLQDILLPWLEAATLSR